MEAKKEVVIDTDFLSSFFKIGKLNLVFKAFNVKEIFITKAVLQELEESNFYDEFLELLNLKENNIIVKKIERIESSKDFGEGELESISLAKRTDSVLLMDDRDAGEFAKDKEVTVVNIPEFLIDCKERNIIFKEEIEQIIQDLKEKDYYEFTEEVKNLLLDDKFFSI